MSQATNVVARISNIIIGIDNTKGRGRAKLIFNAVVKYEMIGLNLNEHLALDRTQWRKKIEM